jgi:transcriptional regulator with AAA-type ATPase domain
MAHITENKVDALILSRRASQNQNSQNTATLKEALHEFIGTAYSPKKRLGIRRYRCTKKCIRLQILQ